MNDEINQHGRSQRIIGAVFAARQAFHTHVVDVLQQSPQRKLVAPGYRAARELRQTSPFAGVLTEQERRRLLLAVENRVLA